jgi:hypothetical protein
MECIINNTVMLQTDTSSLQLLRKTSNEIQDTFMRMYSVNTHAHIKSKQPE